MLRGLIGPAVQAGKQLHLCRLHKPDVPVLEPSFHQNALPLAPAVVFHVVKIRALHQARLPEPVPVYVQPRRKVPVQRIVPRPRLRAASGNGAHAQRRTFSIVSILPPPCSAARAALLFHAITGNPTAVCHVGPTARRTKRSRAEPQRSPRGLRPLLLILDGVHRVDDSRAHTAALQLRHAPLMVVPPGEHTASFIAPLGARPLHGPVPATIWLARR